MPDRIFFGHGACAILAGTYLSAPPLAGIYAERIIPSEGFAGNHIYVTDGVIAFDYHGYSCRQKLLEHHMAQWSEASGVGWGCRIERVAFDLLSRTDLNARKMKGPEEYLHNPIARARKFINRFDHAHARRIRAEHI